MSLQKKQVGSTDEYLRRLKKSREDRKNADKARKRVYQQSRAQRERRVWLVGETVLNLVEQGQWDESEFRQMMDKALTRPRDRALFDFD